MEYEKYVVASQSLSVTVTDNAVSSVRDSEDLKTVVRAYDGGKVAAEQSGEVFENPAERYIYNIENCLHLCTVHSHRARRKRIYFLFSAARAFRAPDHNRPCRTDYSAECARYSKPYPQ